MSDARRQIGAVNRLLADVSARFLGTQAVLVDREILSALGTIGESFDLDRVLLLEFADDGSVAVVKHSWARDGVEPIEGGSVMGPRLPRVFAGIRQGEIANIPDTSALSPEWDVDLQEFRRSGAKSHLSIPFFVAGAPLGCLTFVSVRTQVVWTDDHIDRLSLLAQVFANTLSRRNTERRLLSALSRVKQLQAKLQAENLYLRNELQAAHDTTHIVGNSSALQRVLLVAEQVAPTDVTVLIQGETGTGKDLVACAIHEHSPRSARPLIKVNCASLPSTLAESELFGHEKGAFTGAVSQRMGRFELADGGTIFLDEVGDLPLDVQAKLLRVLQDGEFERLGSGRTKSVDARVIAATNQDLEEAVEQGSFRADLYYRLHVVPITLPPLRERREDIPALVWHFIEKVRVKHGKDQLDVPTETMDALVSYEWPGNVRELENVIERAVVLSPESTLVLHDALIGTHLVARPRTPASRDQNLAAIERNHIRSVLEACGWKVKGRGNAAEQLGLNPSTLRGRMRKLGIDRSSRHSRRMHVSPPQPPMTRGYGL